MATRVSIRCEQTGIIFSSLAEAARAMYLDKATLSRHLGGYPGYRHVNHYTFVKVDENTPPFEPKPMVPYRKTTIRCNQTGEVFETLRQAADKLNISLSSLSHHTNNNPSYPSVSGYSFTVLSKTT